MQPRKERKYLELLVKSNAAQLAKAEAGLGHLLRFLQFLFSRRLALAYLIKDVHVLMPMLTCLSTELVLVSVMRVTRGFMLGLNAASAGPQALTIGAESLRLPCAQRQTCLCFGDTSSVRLQVAVGTMLSDKIAELARSRIDDHGDHPLDHYNLLKSIYNHRYKSKGTSHISVLAADGSAVSATSTINYP